MNTIKEIKMSKDDFIVNSDNSSLKFKYTKDKERFIIDISHLNLISSIKLAILCSTYCFIKDFKRKLCWVVSDTEVYRAISILRLNNTEQMVKKATDERLVAIS